MYNNEEMDRDIRIVYRGPGWGSIVVVAIVSAIIGGLLFSLIGVNMLSIFPGVNNGNQVKERIILTTEEPMDLIPAIAQKVIPSVVGISTVSEITDFFFQRRVTQGFGSGVIVHRDGYILTNDHVVGRANEIMVLLADGRSIAGQLKWREPSIDLAIIKIDATDLVVAELGDSDKITVGELAVAIGNPLGMRFQRTVTAGIISGLERSLTVENQVMEDLIQTDASINPGNSGGPLINSKGQVIGINTVKASAGEGMGFAVPINIAKPIIGDVINHGRFRKVFLGIQGTDPELARLAGVKIDIDRGVLVSNVNPSTPAEKAGIKAGDVILSIDKRATNSMARLRLILYSLSVGQTVDVEILRDNQRIILKVTLEEVP